MKKLLFSFILLSSFGLYTSFKLYNPQDKKQKDKEAIKSMCGCYEVGFNFAETFNYSDDSTYQPSEVKHSKALEWVQLVEDKENKVVMQHLLVIGKGEKQFVMKHWRQDWLYENRELYMYDVDNQWRFVKMDKKAVEGQWTQKVFQVDDSPRYEGSSSWVHIDGKSYWENATDSPLPRREFTKRSDYNVTLRRNRQELTKEGWVHDQDNDKIIREAGKADFILAQEKGYNTYVKVDDAKCQLAQDWWKENKDKWKLVRDNWEKVFSKDKNLKLAQEVEGKRLFEYLFELDTDAENKEINKIINDFVE